MLLGKKNTNCLSCNNGKDLSDKQVNLLGKDGKMYFGASDTKSAVMRNITGLRNEESVVETNRLVVDFGQLHHKSPSQLDSNHPINYSQSPKTDKHLFDIIDEKSFKAKKVKKGDRYNKIGRTRFDSNILMHQNPTATENNVTSMSNNLSHYKTQNGGSVNIFRKATSKLPIGFQVQDRIK